MLLSNKCAALCAGILIFSCFAKSNKVEPSEKSHGEVSAISKKKLKKAEKNNRKQKNKSVRAVGYSNEEVLDEMFSIGSYNSVVKAITKSNQSTGRKSTAVEVADTDGIKIDYKSPSYDKLTPVIGWDRYSCDSANCLSGWVRWWKYLRMKEPVVMEWIDGLILRIYPGNEIFRSMFVRGIYDPNLAVVINSFLSKESVFVDVGSNMGYISLLASRIIGSGGHIYAIEPSKRDFSRLLDNVGINRLSKTISCHRLAISDSTGMAKLSVASEERSALNTLGTEFSFKGVEKIHVEDVEKISLDQFIENEDGASRVDVIKLDVEGSELKALQGAKNTIEKYRPAIVLGLNKNALMASGSSVPDIQSMLSEYRYKTYRIVEKPSFSLEVVDDISKIRESVVFCVHESMMPPTLPQPEKRSFLDSLKHFFTK